MPPPLQVLDASTQPSVALWPGRDPALPKVVLLAGLPVAECGGSAETMRYGRFFDGLTLAGPNLTVSGLGVVGFPHNGVEVGSFIITSGCVGFDM